MQAGAWILEAYALPECSMCELIFGFCRIRQVLAGGVLPPWHGAYRGLRFVLTYLLCGDRFGFARKISIIEICSVYQHTASRAHGHVQHGGNTYCTFLQSRILQARTSSNQPPKGALFLHKVIKVQG